MYEKLKIILTFCQFVIVLLICHGYIDNMTIKNIRLISNNHLESAEMLLDKLLKENDMSQADLAKAVGKDATTINRWVKNSRAIAWENAVEIAKILKCHPVDIYQPRKQIKLRWYIGNDFTVKLFKESEQKNIYIPFEYYHPDVRAVLINIPGSWIDGEVYLFDIPQQKGFSSLSLGKQCYIEPSKIYLKKNPKAVNRIGVVLSNPDYTLKIINPLTGEPLNDANKSFTAEDLRIVSPVKVKYNPHFLHHHID